MQQFDLIFILILLGFKTSLQELLLLKKSSDFILQRACFISDSQWFSNLVCLFFIISLPTSVIHLLDCRILALVISAWFKSESIKRTIGALTSFNVHFSIVFPLIIIYGFLNWMDTIWYFLKEYCHRRLPGISRFILWLIIHFLAILLWTKRLIEILVWQLLMNLIRTECRRLDSMGVVISYTAISAGLLGYHVRLAGWLRWRHLL